MNLRQVIEEEVGRGREVGSRGGTRGAGGTLEEAWHQNWILSPSSLVLNCQTGDRLVNNLIFIIDKTNRSWKLKCIVEFTFYKFVDISFFSCLQQALRNSCELLRQGKELDASSLNFMKA